MPRSRQRFSRLKQLLKDSKGAPDPTSDAGKFLAFLTGQSTYKIDSTKLNAIKEAGGRGANYGTGLKPFNIDPPTDTAVTYFGTYTKYSKSLLGTTLKTDAGHNSTDAKTNTDSAYNPAILRISLKTGDILTPTSQILGKKYTRVGTKTATIPFGCKTAYGESEETRKKALITAATGIKEFYTASYQPEEWNPDKAATKDVYV